MNSAQEVTDAKQVIDISGCTAISGCAQPYSRRYQVQKLQAEAKYTITSADLVSGTPSGFVTLIDGGNPSAVLTANIVGPWTCVNTPVYKTPPTNPVPAVGGGSFNLFLTSSCCSCSQ